MKGLFHIFLCPEVQTVARSAYYQLRLLWQLCSFLDNRDLAMVIHALVISSLNYYNTVQVGLPLKMSRKLQLVQNSATRTHLQAGASWKYITPVLQEFHWLPTSFCTQIKVLVMTFKALHGLKAGYLSDCILQYDPAQPLRPLGEGLLWHHRRYS